MISLALAQKHQITINPIIYRSKIKEIASENADRGQWCVDWNRHERTSIRIGQEIDEHDGRTTTTIDLTEGETNHW